MAGILKLTNIPVLSLVRYCVNNLPLANHFPLPSYLGLEGAPEANDEGVLGKGEDVPLIKDLLNLLFHDHPMLADLLHGEPLPGLLVPHQVHRTGGREKVRWSSGCAIS